MYNNINTIIISEHGILYSLLKPLISISSYSEILVRVKILKTVILEHAQLEDTILFPVLLKSSKSAFLEHMHKDHIKISRLLNTLIRALQNKIPKEKIQKTIRILVESIVLHFKNEEIYLIPYCRKHISNKQLKVLGKKWLRARSVTIS